MPILSSRKPSRRNLFPLVIIGLAVGIWIWSAREKEQVDASVAAVIQHAAEAVCNQEAMPGALSWPTPDLKRGFVSLIQPGCEQAGISPGGLDVHVTRGDHGDFDGRATHQALVLVAGQSLLRLRLVVVDENHVTVIGWSKP